jgi:hypothetical protein
MAGHPLPEANRYHFSDCILAVLFSGFYRVRDGMLAGPERLTLRCCKRFQAASVQDQLNVFSVAAHEFRLPRVMSGLCHPPGFPAEAVIEPNQVCGDRIEDRCADLVPQFLVFVVQAIDYCFPVSCPDMVFSTLELDPSQVFDDIRQFARAFRLRIIQRLMRVVC